MHVIFVGQGHSQKLFNLEHFPIYSNILYIVRMFGEFVNERDSKTIQTFALINS